MPPRTHAQRRREARELARADRRPRRPTVRWRDVPNALRDWSTLSRPQRRVARTKAVVAVGGVALAIVAAFLVASVYDEFVASPAEPVVTVDGVAVDADTYARFLAFRQHVLLQELSALPRAAGGQPVAARAALQAELNGLVFNAVTILADAELVRSEAARRGLAVSPADVDDELARLVTTEDADTAADPTDPLDVMRTATGLDEESLRAFISDLALRRRLTDELVADVGPEPEQVRASHILSADKLQAELVVARLDGLQEFETVARDASTDVATRDQGGALGWVPRGVLPRAWDITAFRLAPGRHSDPIETQDGWYVIRVDERSDARPLDAAASKLLRDARFNAWLATAAADASIQYGLSQDIIEWAQRRASR